MLSIFKKGLKKTKQAIFNTVNENLFKLSRKPSEEELEDLEAALIQADVGVETTMEVVSFIRNRKEKDWSHDLMKNLLQQKMVEVLGNAENLELQNGLNIILIVGVNGVGKTTTIAKLSQRFKSQNKKVLMGACDTFRAGAIEQLSIWGERLGIEVVKQNQGADPAAVAFDAVDKAVKQNYDVLLLDTAGRLHTQKNLMEELGKVYRTVQKKSDQAHLNSLLILDGGTGQNALNQAKQFDQIVPLTGLVITKLDGTAKGGMLFQIKQALKIPIYFVGLGESLDDLQVFDAQEFAEALLVTDHA